MDRFFERILRSRDRLLETGGEFSVNELRETGLGETDPDGGRSLLYVSEVAPVNLVPQNLAEALKDLYEKTSDERLFLQTLHSAFHIYRECVNDDLLAALCKKGSSWEWPETALFSWKDIDAINFMGTAMGAMKKNDSVSVTAREGDQKVTTDLFTGQVSTEKFAGITGNPAENFKYKVNRLADIRMINSQSWQTVTLRAYATAVMRALDSIKGREKSNTDLREFVNGLIEEFPKMKVDFPAGRYAKTGETPAPSFLFAFI